MLRSALLAASLVLVITGCGCAAKPASTGTAPSEPAGDNPTPPDPGAGGSLDLAALGTPCGDDGTCPAGAECVSYFGIAGPSGPEFKSCEVTCKGGKGDCPTGTTCTTIADGPGQVCRAK